MPVMAPRVPGPERLHVMALEDPVSVAVKPAGVLPAMTVNVVGLTVSDGPPPPLHASAKNERTAPAKARRAFIWNPQTLLQIADLGRHGATWSEGYTRRVF